MVAAMNSNHSQTVMSEQPSNNPKYPPTEQSTLRNSVRRCSSIFSYRNPSMYTFTRGCWLGEGRGGVERAGTVTKVVAQPQVIVLVSGSLDWSSSTSLYLGLPKKKSVD